MQKITKVNKEKRKELKITINNNRKIAKCKKKKKWYIKGNRKTKIKILQAIRYRSKQNNNNL